MSPTDTDLALSHFERNQAIYLDELRRLVRIPSVSFPGFPPLEVARSAEAVAELLRRRGMEKVEVLRIEGAHPYVYAERILSEGAPTVLLYAHHDVQPAGEAGEWTSPPFEPAEREGRLYGRGAADDKAGVLVHAAAVDSWVRGAHRVPLNVKMVVEGEEEIGSPHLSQFLERYRSRLQADAMVLTDTGNVEVGVPSVTVALRGMVSVEVEVRAVDQSLHSGLWGGPVPDPALGLARMLSGLVDPKGQIAIPGVLDLVRPLSAVQRAALLALPVGVEEFRRMAHLRPGVEYPGRAPPAGVDLVAPVTGGQCHPGVLAPGRPQRGERRRLGPGGHPTRPRHGPGHGAGGAHPSAPGGGALGSRADHPG